MMIEKGLVIKEMDHPSMEWEVFNHEPSDDSIRMNSYEKLVVALSPCSLLAAMS
jgi:hypothetical protein